MVSRTESASAGTVNKIVFHYRVTYNLNVGGKEKDAIGALRILISWNSGETNESILLDESVSQSQ